MTRYKNFFDQKELQIKMSSPLLNVSNDADGRFAEFPLKDIEVFVDSEEQNWFKKPTWENF